MEHCYEKIIDLLEKKEKSTRDIMQIGYNLGRAAELTGEGREEWWDKFKKPVADEDWSKVLELIKEKQTK